jgi:protein SCO1/2
MFSPDDTPPVISPELHHFAVPAPMNDREPVIDRLVDIALQTHMGPTRMSKLMGDKGIIVQLFYTRCTGVCPGTTAMLKTVAHQLGKRIGKDIVIVSLSLDADRDGLSDIKRYAAMHRLPKGWYAATCSKGDLALLLKQLRLTVTPSKGRDGTIKHASQLVYGSNVSGRWRMINAELPKPELIRDMVELTIDGLSYQRRGVSTGRT